MPYIAFIVYTLVLLKSSYCWEFVKDWQIAINIEVLLCSYFYPCCTTSQFKGIKNAQTILE